MGEVGGYSLKRRGRRRLHVLTTNSRKEHDMDPIAYLAVMNAHGRTLLDFWLEPRRESRLCRLAAVVVRS
jgi:hypothetical protein